MLRWTVVVVLSLARSQHSGGALQHRAGLEPDPTRQGPVLFPNDAPPAPRPPLVVTSRPLAESIARSELAAAVRATASEGDNNTLAASSYLRGQSLAFEPYLARVQQYRLYNPSPTFDYTSAPRGALLAGGGGATSWGGDGAYSDYEDQAVIPPIYRAIADHAQHKERTITQQPDKYKYKAPRPRSSHPPGGTHRGDGSEYDQNEDYAFSYTVKDEATGDDFSHSQKSTGSGTDGEYRVRLPDGRTQVVSYTADERGYRADVRYDRDHDDHGNRREYTGGDGGGGTGGAHVDTNSVYEDDVEYTDRSGHFLYAHKLAPPPGSERDDYHYPDVSKESYNDYSTEYNSHREPHTSKYASFNMRSEQGPSSTLTPSYEELTPLLVDKRVYSTRQQYHAPPSAASPPDGAKFSNLYTSVQSSVPAAPSYATPRVVVASTPRNYLVSTIASLNNNVHLASKPILSDRFLQKINKYLSFN